MQSSEIAHGVPFTETEAIGGLSAAFKPNGCPFQNGTALGDNKPQTSVDIELAEAEARNLKRLQEDNRTPIEQLATLLLRKSNCLQKEVKLIKIKKN